MTDGFGVEGLRNLVFWTATCQTGMKEALTGVKTSCETEVALSELDCMQLTKFSVPGVTSTREDEVAHELEKERVRTKRKTEELSRDFFMFNFGEFDRSVP